MTTSACCRWPPLTNGCVRHNCAGRSLRRGRDTLRSASLWGVGRMSSTMRDVRGNPVGTTSVAALSAAEKALWRMMSFYDAPLADLDRAIADDPAWLLPRVMK